MQTGPRTAHGKATSSMNALSSWPDLRESCSPNEDPAEFQQFLQSLFEDHRPATATEALLVGEMAQAHWRLDRIRQRQDLAFECETLDQKFLALLHRYSTTCERTFFKSLEALKKLQRERLAQSKGDFVSQNKSDAAVLRIM